MPPQTMNKRPQQMCPACGGDPQRGRKKGEPACAVCKGGMSDSPAGKQAMAMAARQGAMKVRQQMAVRQQMQARQQALQRVVPRIAAASRGGAPMGPQGAPSAARPQVDPRMLAMLAAQLRGGAR